VGNDGLEAQGPIIKFDKIVEHMMRLDEEVGVRKYFLVSMLHTSVRNI
jgi:hypothetical protein